VKEGVDVLRGSTVRGYFLLQSGHGHCSQPQPVHASRIMRTVYRPHPPWFVEVTTSLRQLRLLRRAPQKS
jgi:hypothetical protein